MGSEGAASWLIECLTVDLHVCEQLKGDDEETDHVWQSSLAAVTLEGSPKKMMESLSLSLCGQSAPLSLLSAPPISISSLWALVSSGVGSACAAAVSPGTQSSLSAALHLHNHICVPLVCQVNLLMSGPPINNTLLDIFFLFGRCWGVCRIFSRKLFQRKVK